MRSLALLALVVATLAQAQGPAIFVANPGGGSSSTAGTATTADIDLCVDPLGSDSNACTSTDACVSNGTGTAACLTLQGAINKPPKNLRHRVRVFLAPSLTYAGVTVSGFTIDPAFQRATAGILIDGTLTNVTPTTGTATGTATGGTAGTGTTFGTLIDAAQTWTVNDFRGKLLVKTGGTGSGEVRMITANTATTITIAGAHTAPTGTTTYAIQTNGTVISTPAALIPGPLGTSAVAAAGIQVLDNVASSNGNFITIRNIGISVGASAAIDVIGGQNVIMEQMIIVGGGVRITGNGGLSTSVFLRGSVVTPGGNAILATQSAVTVNGSYLNCTSSCVNIVSQGRGVISTSSVVSSGLIGINIGAGSFASITSMRCDCTSVANSSCVNMGGTGSGTPQSYTSANINTGLNVTNCDFGLTVQNASLVFALATLSGNALTNAVRSNYGGNVVLPTAASYTITAAVADLSIDSSASTSTFAALTAADSCLAGLGTGSRICRQ